MSNEYAPDSRQSVDLKWKLRKALEKNVAPRDDGKGLDFGQDVGIDGKLHLNDLGDIVGPDGSALFTDSTQESYASMAEAAAASFGVGRYSGTDLSKIPINVFGNYIPSGLVSLSTPLSFYGCFANSLLPSGELTMPDFASSYLDLRFMYFSAKGSFSFAAGNVENGNAGEMFTNSGLTAFEVPEGKTFAIERCYLMFDNCASLTKAVFQDASKLDDSIGNGFVMNTPSLTELRLPGVKHSFDVSTTGLAHDGLVALINDLAVVTTAQTLTMGDEKLALLSDEEKLGATNKGWTLA